MERIASIMYLNPGMEVEYEKRHREIWPEMTETLKEYGASNYSIFLNKDTGHLFAYLEVPDKEKYNQISQTEVCQRWWKHMEPLMKTNPDNNPVTTELKEVFYMK